MDRVEVVGLSFHAKHGCHPEERKTGGQFEVDVTVYGDFSRSAQTDDLSDAVDYVALMDLCSEIMSTPHNLIESIAAKIAERTLSSFPSVLRVDVKVKKLQPPVSYPLQFVSASTSLER